MSLTCPQCGKRMTMDFETSRVFCPHCGHIRRDEISGLDQARQNVPPQRAIPITFRGEISRRAMIKYEEGHTLLAQGEIAPAIRAFQAATEVQPEFTDPHLWIAKSSPDPGLREYHADWVLAYDPGHAEATRIKMLLTGRLTPQQDQRIAAGAEPLIRTAAEPVLTSAETLLCPRCNGHLTLNHAAGQVECRSCGHQAPLSESGAPIELFSVAVLKRKAQAVRWEIGQRVVQCRQCGAQHTVPAIHLAAACRFCGAHAVMVSDAHGAFEQPDGLIPFALSQADAESAVQTALSGIRQRVANLFNTNRVQSMTLNGVYMPFWAFDVVVEITRTHTTYRMGRSSTNHWREMDMIEMPVPGVKSPAPSVVARLLPFNLSEVRAYDPRWLAAYPAQLYAVDFETASLNAREQAAVLIKQRYDPGVKERTAGEGSNLFDVDNRVSEVINTQARIQNMTFQLLLLPVWVATLTEVDGDIRLGLINGQTGKVAFGHTVRQDKRAR